MCITCCAGSATTVQAERRLGADRRPSQIRPANTHFFEFPNDIPNVIPKCYVRSGTHLCDVRQQWTYRMVTAHLEQ